ncbi:hypothetical protein L211DRAFT_291574 [Terfezia boudieri ATCC MYA-4762]|uniref:Uncharacterized protein n=1 Tax=Terfezia boudieri ATCC MYA-4762 TaxID=1051890 RepID=A0A3N4LJC8_9PEZI|nr:hypothetical protein L211DRAFT_291574 [Terfezia boudieri ATCC MYA-4762]
MHCWFWTFHFHSSSAFIFDMTALHSPVFFLCSSRKCRKITLYGPLLRASTRLPSLVGTTPSRLPLLNEAQTMSRLNLILQPHNRKRATYSPTLQLDQEIPPTDNGCVAMQDGRNYISFYSPGHSPGPSRHLLK